MAVLAFTGAGSPLPPAPIAAAGQGGTSPQPTLTVTGEGEARAEPDLAVVSVGVTHLAPTSREAMDEVSRRLAAVIAAARALGISDRDVQTTGLSLQPVFRPRLRADEPPEIEAYRATNNVSLTVRDLGRAGAVLDAAVVNGANVIGGLRFGISNLDELRLRALASAAANADAKARAMAGAAGVAITGVVSLAEESISVPRPPAEALLGLRAAPAAEQPPTPVEAGELVVRARVRASYAIQD